MANIIFFDANELISFAKASIQANLADPADFPNPQTLLNNLLADLTSAGYTVRTTTTVVDETQQGYTSTQQQEALIQQFVNYAKNLDPQFVDPNVGPFVIRVETHNIHHTTAATR
jgi:hypothetical protein